MMRFEHARQAGLGALVFAAISGNGSSLDRVQAQSHAAKLEQAEGSPLRFGFVRGGEAGAPRGTHYMCGGGLPTGAPEGVYNTCAEADCRTSVGAAGCIDRTPLKRCAQKENHHGSPATAFEGNARASLLC